VKKFCSILLLCIVLSGCAVATKNISDGQPLSPDQGIIVTKIHSNWESYNFFRARLGFYFRKVGSDLSTDVLILTQADDLKVISLPKGEYRWSHIGIGNRYLMLDGLKGFKVEAGKITYIGDIYSELDLDVYWVNTKVQSEFESIKSDLERQYPELFRSSEIIEKLTLISPRFPRHLN